MLRNGLEPWHLILVLVVVVLLFGSKKLPEIARGLGKSMRILKAETKAMRDDSTTVERVAPTEQPPTAAPAAPGAPRTSAAPGAPGEPVAGEQPPQQPERKAS